MKLALKHEHAWDVTGEQAEAIQRRLAPLVAETPLPGPIRTIAGIDVSFPRPDLARAAVVVLSYPDQTPLEQTTAELPVHFPYIPGLLSFRETPVVLAALEKLGAMPDLLMCDAQGRAHFRRLGLASHVGVLLDHPTIGCAKSRLVGTHHMPGEEKGSYTWLYDGEEVIGAVVRTRTGTSPVYVSVGHKIDLPTAIAVVLTCTLDTRLPEPTRLAHQVAGGAQVVARGEQLSLF
ncbi:MAG: deoxyribonuclease V [Anaerolineae bacterium]|nr:deoxyribonuclease V [Anaerolineae bacterium]